MSDAQHAAELVIQRAQARLDGQSRDNDALDVKALGVVAADAAVFTLLAIVHHDSLNAYWGIPAGAVIVGGLLLTASVFRHRCRSRRRHTCLSNSASAGSSAWFAQCLVPPTTDG